MRNRFPGICYRCGTRVEVGEGHFEKQGRTWLTQHADCAIVYRDTKVGKNEPHKHRPTEQELIQAARMP